MYFALKGRQLQARGAKHHTKPDLHLNHLAARPTAIITERGHTA